MTIPTFPVLAGLAYPVKRTPLWKTQHQESVSGKDNPLQLWSYPRRRYVLKFNVLRLNTAYAELQKLEGFYNLLGGSAGVFQYNDVVDGAVTAQQFGIGTGSSTEFQLVRTWGGFVEPVWAPIGAIAVFINGAPTSSYSVGPTGMITFTSAPASGVILTWTGAFNWLCRFDEDSSDFDEIMSQLWQAGKIQFTTIKLP